MKRAMHNGGSEGRASRLLCLACYVSVCSFSRFCDSTNCCEPSEISYDGENIKWGFMIDEFAPRHRWFKLNLHSSHRGQLSTLAAALMDPNDKPLDKSSTDLITDYLTALREHAERVLPHKLPAGALQSTPIEYILTVPAVWNEAEQAQTRLCAEKAGIGTGTAIQMISEPEAAAIYALDALDHHGFKIGDTFTLVDAGGGTVDLISYTITSLKPDFRVVEASPGTGGLCGSSYLNRKFRDIVRDRCKGDSGFEAEALEEVSVYYVTNRKLHAD